MGEFQEVNSETVVQLLRNIGVKVQPSKTKLKTVFRRLSRRWNSIDKKPNILLMFWRRLKGWLITINLLDRHVKG